MNFEYISGAKRLNVYGTNSEKDIRAIKKLIAEKKIPAELTAIVYQKAKNSTVGMIIRGRHLENFLKVEVGTVVPLPPRPGIKAILKQINEANTRQATYAGLLLYCSTTRRFLFFTPRNRGNLVQLIGDNPTESETPQETVCRVAHEDGDITVAPNCLLALSPIEINGTTYYSYLCFTKNEFRPTLSSKMISFTWKEYEKLGDLSLHPSVSALFEKDKKLQRLVQPEVDFEKLIDEILHSA